jgi:hypothetical protein
MRANTSPKVVEISGASRRGTIGGRRSVARLPLAYTLILSKQGEELRVVTKTENVNYKGFYCVSERRFLPHERLDCEMVIGASRFHGDDLVLHALVEVLRVTPLGVDKGFGVACRLESYTVGPRSDFSGAA